MVTGRPQHRCRWEWAGGQQARAGALGLERSHSTERQASPRAAVPGVCAVGQAPAGHWGQNRGADRETVGTAPPVEGSSIWLACACACAGRGMGRGGGGQTPVRGAVGGGWPSGRGQGPRAGWGVEPGHRVCPSWDPQHRPCEAGGRTTLQPQVTASLTPAHALSFASHNLGDHFQEPRWDEGGEGMGQRPSDQAPPGLPASVHAAQSGSPRSRLHTQDGCGSGWDSSWSRAGPHSSGSQAHTPGAGGVLFTEEAAMEAGREPVPWSPGSAGPGHLRVSDLDFRVFRCGSSGHTIIGID